MKLNKIFKVDMSISFKAYSFEYNEDKSIPYDEKNLLQIEDIRQFACDGVLGVFVWFGGPSNLPNAPQPVNTTASACVSMLVIYDNRYVITTNGMTIWTLPLNPSTHPDLYELFGTNTVGIATIRPQYNPDDVIGGYWNYGNTLSINVNGYNASRTYPPMQSYIGQKATPSVTTTEFTINATPDENGNYFPLFFDNYISKEFGNDLSEWIKTVEDDPQQSETNVFNGITLEKGHTSSSFYVNALTPYNRYRVTTKLLSDVYLKFSKTLNSLRANKELISYLPYGSRNIYFYVDLDLSTGNGTMEILSDADLSQDFYIDILNTNNDVNPIVLTTINLGVVSKGRQIKKYAILNGLNLTQNTLKCKIYTNNVDGSKYGECAYFITTPLENSQSVSGKNITYYDGNLFTQYLDVNYFITDKDTPTTSDYP